MMPAWPLLALAFSFCGAVIIGYNQWARLDGRALVVLRVVGVWPLALLSLAFLPWPQHASFYAAAAGMGALLSYGDVLLFNASAQHGGRLAALYVPLKMMTGFVLWALLEPESLLPLLLQPWRVGVLALGFSLCGGALMFLRRADAGWAALVAVVPVAVLFALVDVVAKAELGPVTAQHGLLPVLGSTVAFLTVTNTVGALGGLVLGKPWKPTGREVLLAGLFGVILLAGLSVLLVTLALAPNPGYVAAITMLSALWLAVLGYVRRKEHNNWWAGLALVAGAMAVAVATAL